MGWVMHLKNDMMTNRQLPVEIQNYINFANKTDLNEAVYVTKDRIDQHFKEHCEFLNTMMVYPDLLADIMTPRDSHFNLFPTQRMVLRAMSRYRQSYFTFTRSFSKSFLAFYYMYTACMFIPRTAAFVVAGTKAQAAQIAREKVIGDLWTKFPLMQNEMQKFRRAGKLKDPFSDGGDSVRFNFANGSIFDVVGGHIRGGRRTKGLFEEVIEQDPTYVNEEVIPLLNTIRTDSKGRINPNEPQGTKIFITTAGYMGTFAYNKLIEVLCMVALDPTKYCVMGGTYKILLLNNRLAEDVMREIMSAPTFSKEAFEREYCSIWSGKVKGAAFSSTMIENIRKIRRAEYKAAKSVIDHTSDDFYVISCDIAKDGSADTAVVVGRVSPTEYKFVYKIVNAFQIDANDFMIVANELKAVAIKYAARLLVYDANGVGAGLRDWLNKPTVTSTGMPLPGLGIINPPESALQNLSYYRDPAVNIVYEIKSGGTVASNIHARLFAAIGSGAIRTLIPSREAIAALENNATFIGYNSRKKDLILRPYRFIDKLQKELMNLDVKDNGDATTRNIIIVRRDTNTQKDYFSALEYLIYATTEHLENNYYKEKRRANTKMKTLTFMSPMNKPTRGKNKIRR